MLYCSTDRTGQYRKPAIVQSSWIFPVSETENDCCSSSAQGLRTFPVWHLKDGWVFHEAARRVVAVLPWRWWRCYNLGRMTSANWYFRQILTCSSYFGPTGRPWARWWWARRWLAYRSIYAMYVACLSTRRSTFRTKPCTTSRRRRRPRSYPSECALHPEGYTELNDPITLDKELKNASEVIDDWIEANGKQDVENVKHILRQNGMGRSIPNMDLESYHYSWSVSPCTKMGGGYVAWVQENNAPMCDDCNHQMEHMLTIASYDGYGQRWYPIDEKASDLYQLSSGLEICAYGKYYLFVCWRCERLQVKCDFQKPWHRCRNFSYKLQHPHFNSLLAVRSINSPLDTLLCPLFNPQPGTAQTIE